MVTIKAPASHGSYKLGATVIASWTATDALSGINAALTSSVPVANGVAIDTSSAGQKTFTVTATDNAGNVTTKTVTYTVTSTRDMRLMKIVKDLVLLLVCAALIVPTVLLVTGKLPYKIYVVHTGSMIPTIPPKSAVIVKEGVYHVGQVISFHTLNGVVTHRVVKRNPDGTLVTKGDGNRTVDPGAPLQPTQVIGGVVAAPRLVGYLLWYLRKPAGLASVTLTILCVWLMWSLAAEYAKRGQRTGTQRRSRGYRGPGRRSSRARRSSARKAAQKPAVAWHFVEWPLDVAALAAWTRRPAPPGSPEQAEERGPAETDDPARSRCG